MSGPASRWTVGAGRPGGVKVGVSGNRTGVNAAGSSGTRDGCAGTAETAGDADLVWVGWLAAVPGAAGVLPEPCRLDRAYGMVTAAATAITAATPAVPNRWR